MAFKAHFKTIMKSERNSIDSWVNLKYLKRYNHEFPRTREITPSIDLLSAEYVANGYVREKFKETKSNATVKLPLRGGPMQREAYYKRARDPGIST